MIEIQSTSEHGKYLRLTCLCGYSVRMFDFELGNRIIKCAECGKKINGT